MENDPVERLRGKDLMNAIESSCDGLMYVSETDAKVEPFFGDRVAEVIPAAVVKAANIERGAAFEKNDFDELFDRLTAARAWYTSAQRENARRFESLRRILKANLAELRVYRFGKIQIEIFVVGIDADGNLAGVRTRAVET